MKNNKTFEENIQELRELYQENPKKVENETKKLVSSLKITNTKLLENVDLSKLIIAICCIFMALIGLINIGNENASLYYFGFIFFIAGLLIGIYIKGFGLIFLFSHGCTGLSIMIGSTLGNYLKEPILSDMSKGVYIYLGILIAIIICGLIITILTNLSEKIKSKPFADAYPVIIMSVAILLVELFPVLYNTISKINF